MISLQQALEKIGQNVMKTPTERVDLSNSLNRVLAEDVFSDVEMPPFDKSAVDGFACRLSDIDKELEVIETIAAGQVPTKEVGYLQCSKIMTGAMVPPGANAVVMVEQTHETKPGFIAFDGKSTNTNIAYQGEEVKKGEKVLKMGCLIKPQHIPILASVGWVNPLVSCKPRVAIMSTGDELVEPHEKPSMGQIRNSNSFQLMAQVAKAGCIANYFGIIPDNEKATDEAIGLALQKSDIVILTGGVSMGDFDFVPKIFKKNGVEIVFHKVAIKPGRPTLFGRTSKSYVFGLPGNPVSSFIAFELFAKPLFLKMMGCNDREKSYYMKAGVDINRKKDGRTEFFPVVINDNDEVIPVRYTGSAHLHALATADGIVEISGETLEIKKGEEVNVRPI